MRLAILFLLVVATASAATYSGAMLVEGQTQTFLGATKEYVLQLRQVSDRNEEAIFQLGDELSKPLKEREKYRFRDGSLVIVGDILVDEAGDQPDFVHFYFVTGSGTLADGGEYDLGPLAEQMEQITEPKVAGLIGQQQTECLTFRHCNDQNPCTTDQCLHGECVYEQQEGCPIAGQCIPYQKVITNGAGAKKYCTLGGLKEQKDDGMHCRADFECKHACIDGVCASEKVEVPSVPEPRQEAPQPPQTFWERFWGFFRNLYK